MDLVLQKLLKTCQVEYVTVNKDLLIQQASANINNFILDANEIILGEDIRLAVPEFFGIENILLEVFEGKRTRFDLRSLARDCREQETCYLDICIIATDFQAHKERELIVFFIDATERITIEQSLVQRENQAYLLLNQLESSKNYIDKVVDSMADALIITDTQGKIKQVNRAAQFLLGYSYQELELQPLSLIIEDRNFLTKVDDLNSGDTQGLTIEAICKSKSGKKLTVAFSCTYMQIEGDEQVLVCIGRDITESKQQENLIRKLNAELSQRVEERTAEIRRTLRRLEQEVGERQRTEIALKRSEARLRSLLNSLKDVVWSLTYPPINILYLNPVATALFGYSVEEIKDDPQIWQRLIYREDRSLIIKFLNKIVELGQYEIEYRILREDRQVRWVNSRGWLINTIGKKIYRIDGITTDITERKRAEELNKAKLIQSEKMSSLGQMVAGVAHEINNPLSFIYSNLSYANNYFQDLLSLVKVYQQEYPEDNIRINRKMAEIELDFIRQDLPNILRSMEMGTSRIRKLVLSLRNFSRLDESAMKLVNIHEGLDSTLTLLQPRLRAKGDRPEILIFKEYRNLPRILCYPGDLNQVFINILDNAIEALDLDPNPKKQPEIKISTALSDKNSLVIKIADNGPGIDAATKEKIFDPFFTTKPVGSGTGLGLLICYSIIVESHGGKIDCYSVLGQGTEFLIEIPVQQDLLCKFIIK